MPNADHRPQFVAEELVPAVFDVFVNRIVSPIDNGIFFGSNTLNFRAWSSGNCFRPHLGYGTRSLYEIFYRDSVANIKEWILENS